MDKLKRVLSGNENDDEERNIISQLRDNSKLSYGTRIKCFIACFIIGILLTFLGSFALFLGGVKLFAVFYTLGNILSIASTCFLMGPMNQIKKMFAATRAIATILVLVSFTLTLMAGLWWKKPPLALLCIIIQSCAMTWYSISYIPYARDAVKSAVSTCIV